MPWCPLMSCAKVPVMPRWIASLRGRFLASENVQEKKTGPHEAPPWTHHKITTSLVAHSPQRTARLLGAAWPHFSLWLCLLGGSPSCGLKRGPFFFFYFFFKDRPIQPFLQPTYLTLAENCRPGLFFPYRPVHVRQPQYRKEYS